MALNFCRRCRSCWKLFISEAHVCIAASSALPPASWHLNASQHTSVHTCIYVNPTASFTLHPGGFWSLSIREASKAHTVQAARRAVSLSHHVIDLPAFLALLISVARTNQSWDEKKGRLHCDLIAWLFSSHEVITKSLRSLILTQQSHHKNKYFKLT